MLQLYMAMEPSTRFGLQEKSETYLEIFGNMMIRDVSSRYLVHAANRLIRAVTNLGPSSLDFIDLSYLKFKERDMLELVLKFWRGSEGTMFDASKCWDYRLRKHLGTRYDAIPNVFDWDCSITLHDRKATQIYSKEYAHWRHFGNAFELREADYNTPNRSLASRRVLKNSTGDKGVYWGYWGDIICSPYLAFGIDTSECPELNRRVNGKHAYSATTISEVNIRKIFWQLMNRKKCPIHIAAPFLETSTTTNDGDVPYERHGGPQNDLMTGNELHNDEENINNQTEGSCTDGYTKLVELKEDSVSASVPAFGESKQSNNNSFVTQFDNIEYVPLDITNTFKVKFLPVNSFLDLSTRYRSIFIKTDNNTLLSKGNRFRIIYIGNSLVHLLSDLHSQEEKYRQSLSKVHHKNKLNKEKETKKNVISIGNDKNLESDLFTTDLSEVSFTDLLEDEALLIVESVLYIVEIRAEQIKVYCERVKQMAYNLGFEILKEIKPLEDHHLYFRFKRKLNDSP
ncbi:unnamed protein product [Heterobilharzia americana]|nr:unnamed protein product [Heterobilharzia americana]